MARMNRGRSRSETVPTSKPSAAEKTLDWPHLIRSSTPVVSDDTLWDARRGATKLQERHPLPDADVALVWRMLGLAPTPGRRRG